MDETNLNDDTINTINNVTTITEWKNEPTVTDLSGDLEEAESTQELHRENLRKWTLAREGGKTITVRPGKSSVRPLLIRKQNEWKYPALEEPFLNTIDMFEIRPRTAEDTAPAKQNGMVLNYQWSEEINKTKLIGDIVRTVVDEGTVIVKTGWEVEYGTKIVEREEPDYASPEESYQMMQESVEAGEMSPEEAQAMVEMGQPVQKGVKKVYAEEETMLINRPTYEVCNNANVIIDPTCEGIIANANFVVHEYDTSLSDLKKYEYVKGKEATEDSEGTEESGYYHNLKEIKTLDEETTDDEFMSYGANNFKYKDKPRKKLRAKEYWGFWDINKDGVLVSIVATWVGKTMIRMEENPFPHGQLPFSLATYMPVKKDIHGEPDAELLSENQDSYGRMTRAINDITAAQAVGQKFIDENLFPNPAQKGNYEKGNTVYFRTGLDPRTSIHKDKVETVPQSAFQMLQLSQSEAEGLTGTRAFAGQGAAGNALGSTATGVRSALDATAKRELSILRRLSDMLFKSMARMTIAMNQEFMPEESVIRITNGEFATVRRDDLGGSFDLRINVSTPEKDNETAEKLMTLMQTNAANMDPGLAAKHYVKIATLWKMPDLAAEIENFKPEPNPKQEALLDLQMENARLENEKLKKVIEESDSKILERLSRAQENDVDMRLKSAEAALKEAEVGFKVAQADKLNSETDKLDQEFIDNHSGARREREIEDQEYKAETAAETQAKKAAYDERSKVVASQVTKNTMG